MVWAASPRAAAPSMGAIIGLLYLLIARIQRFLGNCDAINSAKAGRAGDGRHGPDARKIADVNAYCAIGFAWNCSSSVLPCSAIVDSSPAAMVWAMSSK